MSLFSHKNLFKHNVALYQTQAVYCQCIVYFYFDAVPPSQTVKTWPQDVSTLILFTNPICLQTYGYCMTNDRQAESIKVH